MIIKRKLFSESPKSLNRSSYKKAGTSGVAIPSQVWKENEGLGVKGVPTKNKFRFTREDVKDSARRGKIKYDTGSIKSVGPEAITPKKSGSILSKATKLVKENPKTAIGLGSAALATGLVGGLVLKNRKNNK